MALTAIPNDRLADALRDGEEASASELLALATSKDTKVRMSLAERPDIPMSAAIMLAQDGKSAVRRALASGPGVGSVQTAVTMLASDKDVDVVVTLLANAHVPLSWLRPLLDHPKAPVRRAAEARFASQG